MHLPQKFLIVLTEIPKNSTIALDDVFGILWKNGLINSHVLIHDTKKSWSLYAFLPHQKDGCILRHFKIESFTQFNFSSSINMSIDQMYPEKLKNFNGCPLHIAPTVFLHYVMLLNTSDGGFHYAGIDILILNEISKALNFTIRYIFPLIKTQRGLIAKNRTWVESFELVFMLIFKSVQIYLT